MQIGYTTWGMPDVPVDTAIPFLADLGFDAVELTVLPEYTTAIERLSSPERRRIKQLFDRHSISMPAVAAHRSLLAENGVAHAKNMEILTSAVDLCAEWADGAGHPVLDTVLGGRPEDWAAKQDFIAARVRELVDYATPRGVIIGMEAHIGAALDTPEKCIALVKKTDSPYLRLNFDISHFEILGLPTEEMVRMMAPYAAHTHVKDHRGLAPDFEFLIPGEGEFDFVTYLRAMRDIGYTGSITAEVSKMVQNHPDYDPMAAAEMCYRTLADAFEQAGIER